MDFLSFALDLVAAEIGIDRSALAPLERRIRHEQGGDRHYIASPAALDCRDRHRAILHALADGATPSQVAQRFGLTRQQIHNVKRASNALP